MYDLVLCEIAELSDLEQTIVISCDFEGKDLLKVADQIAYSYDRTVHMHSDALKKLEQIHNSK